MTQPERLVSINGELAPESEARLSIYDSALMFGDMVFEMTRSFNREHFKLQEHIDRLYASAAWVAIDIPMTKAEMIDAVYEVAQQNEGLLDTDDEHRMMINVTRGLPGIYAGRVQGQSTGPKVIIADFPLRWTVSPMAPLFETGVNAVIPAQQAIPAYLMEPKVKNRSRLFYMMANLQVSQVKGDNNWALMTDPDGFITEGTGANFFIVRDGRLFTPEPRNILRGISRDYIMDLAREMNIECVESNLEPFDIMQADEAFMTATPFCMIPVVSLDSRPIGDGKPGELTGQLLSEWGNRVDVDIVDQIKSWNVADAETAATRPIAPTPYEFRKE